VCSCMQVCVHMLVVYIYIYIYIYIYVCVCVCVFMYTWMLSIEGLLVMVVYFLISF
jgi:hypothetical protein